jgi:hypothetical protein
VPALLVHPSFSILTAFIGNGLVFAGVTDTCAMEKMPARLPSDPSASRGARPRVRARETGAAPAHARAGGMASSCRG